MAKTQKRETGDWGEGVASRFLLGLGYTVVARNFSIRFGEIDIIAWHDKPQFGKTLCFVEVKTRSSDDGSAQRSVNEKKLNRIKSTAHKFCMEQEIDIGKTPIQFEEITIVKDGHRPLCIRHYIIPAL